MSKTILNTYRRLLSTGNFTEQELSKDLEGLISFTSGILTLHISCRRLTFKGFVPENVQKFLNDLLDLPKETAPTRKDALKFIEQSLEMFHSKEIVEYADRNNFYAYITKHLLEAMKYEIAPFVTESLVDEIKKVLNEVLSPKEKNVLENFYTLGWFANTGPMFLGSERLRQIREKAKAIARIKLSAAGLLISPKDHSVILTKYRTTNNKLASSLEKVLIQNARLRAENTLYARNASFNKEEQKILAAINGDELVTSTGLSIKLLRTPIEELGLCTREFNCLWAGRLRTLGKIVQETEEDLLRFRNFGKKSLRLVKEMLESKGLALNMKISPEDLTLLQEEG